MPFSPKAWKDAPDTTTPLSAAALVDLETRLSQYTDQAMPVGTVVYRALPGEPPGWLLCNGQAVTADYPVLRAALVDAGSPFGTSGSNPRLPDLTARFPRGAGSGEALGATGGADTVALSTAQLPVHSHGAGSLSTSSAGAHTHTYEWHVAADAASGTANGMFSPVSHSPNQSRATSSAGAHTHTITGSTANAGTGAAHENRPPYINLYALIRAY